MGNPPQLYNSHFDSLTCYRGYFHRQQLTKVKVYRDFSLYTGRPCTSILKKYYEGKLKNNQRGGMKLVSISAVRLVIIVMVAYVIVLVQSDSTFIFLAPVSSTKYQLCIIIDVLLVHCSQDLLCFVDSELTKVPMLKHEW